MTRLMKPHPGYRILWIVLQVAGIAACYLLDAWGLYFAAVAALEGIALLRHRLKGRSASGTWSWVVWFFVFDEDGRASLPRAALAAAWTFWFSWAFTFHGWFPWWWANALIAGLFMAWNLEHWFRHVVPVHDADEDEAEADPPAPGGAVRPEIRRGELELDPEHDGDSRPTDGGARRSGPYQT